MIALILRIIFGLLYMAMGGTVLFAVFTADSSGATESWYALLGLLFMGGGGVLVFRGSRKPQQAAWAAAILCGVTLVLLFKRLELGPIDALITLLFVIATGYIAWERFSAKSSA